MAYKNPSYTILSLQDGHATVQISADFQWAPTSHWIEESTKIQLVKQGDTWRAPSSFVFNATPSAQQTMISDASTVTAATAVVQNAVRGATATAQQNTVNATETALTQERTLVATVSAQGTESAVLGMQLAQATKVANATAEAHRVATEVSGRTVALNQRMVLEKTEDTDSQMESYLANVNLTLVSVERTDDSVVLHFRVWNHNTEGGLLLSATGDDYLTSVDGTRYQAKGWNAVTIQAGVRSDFVVAIAAPSAPGTSYTLNFVTAGPVFDRYFLTWRPVQLRLSD